MSRKTDIEALLNRADKTLLKINDEYEKALHAKEISADLRIDIKDFFGNLRSVLDYIAHDIVEKYCPTANPKKNLYFPQKVQNSRNSIRVTAAKKRAEFVHRLLIFRMSFTDRVGIFS